MFTKPAQALLMTVVCALVGCAAAPRVPPTPPLSSAIPSPTAGAPAPASATASPTGSDGPGPVAKQQSLRPEFSDVSTQFAFDLLKAIARQDAGKNIFISPANVSIALAMAANGAQGDTLQAMLKSLGAPGASLDQLNLDYAALQQLLKRADPKVVLSIANSLWARQGVPFNAGFLQRTQQFYDAQISELDFSQPAAADAINAWVKDSTNDKINGIASDIPPETVMLIVSAIYFNGTWQRTFNTEQTQDAPFNLPTGTQKQVPMMFQSGLFAYLKGDGFQAVQLPYQGEALRMVVFLPDEGSSLDPFGDSLTVENWRAWSAQFAPKQGNLLLPRFKVEYNLALNDALKQLGMEIAFDPERADFSGMRPIPPNVFISNVQHKAFVDVNETGTEAAAATSIEMGVTSARPIEETFTMTVDRPFFVAIEDSQTGALIFTGMIVEP